MIKGNGQSVYCETFPLAKDKTFSKIWDFYSAKKEHGLHNHISVDQVAGLLVTMDHSHHKIKIS